MPVNRMRMRPWLTKMIDSKTISGLEWTDKVSAYSSPSAPPAAAARDSNSANCKISSFLNVAYINTFYAI